MSGRCDAGTDAVEGLLDKPYGKYTISFHQDVLTTHAHEYTPDAGRQPLSAAHRSALPDITPRLELRDTTGPTLHAMAAARCPAIPGFTCARKSMLLGPQAHALRPDRASAHASAAAAMRCASRRRTPPTPLSLPRSPLRGGRRTPPPLPVLEEEVGAPPPTQWSIHAAPERSHGSDRHLSRSSLEAAVTRFSTAAADVSMRDS